MNTAATRDKPLVKRTPEQEQAAREACFRDCSAGVHADPENGCFGACKSVDRCEGWVPYLNTAADMRRGE